MSEDKIEAGLDGQDGSLPPPVPPRVRQHVRLDPRRHAFRADLAAQSLYGRVDAPAFADGKTAQVMRASVPLRRRPVAAAGFETEALFGEILTVYDEADGWAWVQLERDKYVGYVPADTLTWEVHEPTHWVRALGTFLYPIPDIKAPPLMHLSMNAGLAVTGGDEKFRSVAGGGFVITRHIAEPGRYARDFVDVAERFIGTPYLWGGRTRVGVDCSGLLQIALESAGIACPRDSDMQQSELGEDVLIPSDLEGLRRGDIVFWKGHVGIMVDSLMLVHANAHHMAVVVETLPEAVERIRRAGSEINAVRRLPGLTA